MKISTGWSTAENSAVAVSEAFEQISRELGTEVSLLVVYASVMYDGQELLDALAVKAPGVPVHGGTSCMGVMTAAGFHSADGLGLGILGISDPAGTYGVGMARIGSDARSAGAEAIRNAIAASGRLGEPPHLVWMNGAPGGEESLIQGIQDVIGSQVPIAGGSTADNTVEGHWEQFVGTDIHTDAVVVSAFYPSVKTSVVFHNGYSPTSHKGKVTRVEGRTLYEIDGRPAAEVYNEWAGGAIDDFLDGGNILQATTMQPLGRVVGTLGDLPYYVLSHPDSVTSDGALTLFSDVQVGDLLVLMSGTHASLVTRAGRVASTAAGNLGTLDSAGSRLSGALVIYCAGCMLAVHDQMNSVADEVSSALGGAPFIGAFTFGEQGCFVSGENRHGNLMIAVVAFGA